MSKDLHPPNSGQHTGGLRPKPATPGRLRQVVAAGYAHDERVARDALDSPAPAARAASLGALARMGRLSQSDVEKAASDPDGVVRARAAELWETLAGDGALGLPAHQRLVAALSDPDARVVEAACWTLGHLAGRAPAGERGQPDSATRDNQAGNAFAPRDVALALAEVCTTHPNTVCREAAATALGRVGDLAGLDALMHALNDKAPVRRRAVIALASFRASSRRAGEPGRRSVAFRVEGALRQLLEDRDWQVRQAAEDILRR